MSSAGLPRPQPGHGRGWWIAGGVFAVLLTLFGLLYAALPRFSGPIKILYGHVSGNPYMPNCHTTTTREATIGPCWHRILDMSCPTEAMHFVYVKRGTGPGFVVFPAFISAGSPAPVSVREAADGLEVLLSGPLADGRTAVPLELDPMPNAKLFDHGHETASLRMEY